MLYRTLQRLIATGQTEGLEEKLDLFYTLSKLTEEEYYELRTMLHPEQERA